MANKKLSPSMMCVEIEKLSDYLKVFEAEGIEYLHIDVMDGDYVPNFMLGTDYIKQLRRLTKIPLDIHMITWNPEKKLEWFDIQPGEYVSVHAGSTPHLQKALQIIKAAGGKAMVALNPNMRVEEIEYVLDDIDSVLVMTVNPGFAGQTAVPQAIRKIETCRKYLDEKGYPNIEIEVDGNVSYELAAQMAKCGADIFVAGTSSFLQGLNGVGEGIRKMRKIVE